MNTAAALGHVFTMVRLANRILDNKGQRKTEGARELFRRVLAEAGAWTAVLGVFGRDPAEFLAELRACRVARKSIDPARVEELMQARVTARADKDFARADAIRDEIAALGIEVRDTPSGAVWDVL